MGRVINNNEFDITHTKGEDYYEEEIPEEVRVEQTDRMTQDYEIIELSVPEELKLTEKERMQVLSIQDNEVYIITYTASSAGGGHPPTNALYLYHTDTQEMELLNTYSKDEYVYVAEARVINGDLYEIRECAQSRVDIVYNGKVIQTNQEVGLRWNYSFANVNGKLQYITCNKENEEYWLYLYELDKGNIKELYKEEFELLSFQENLSGIKINQSHFLNRNDLLAFTIVDEKKNEFALHVYDGETVSRTLLHLTVKQEVIDMVPLKDGVFINTAIERDNKDTFGAYWYDHSTKKTTWVSSEVKYATWFRKASDNEFIYRNGDENNEDKEYLPNIGTIVNGELKTRILDKAPKGMNDYGRISDNQDFIVYNDLVRINKELFQDVHFYLVNWLK